MAVCRTSVGYPVRSADGGVYCRVAFTTWLPSPPTLPLNAPFGEIVPFRGKLPEPDEVLPAPMTGSARLFRGPSFFPTTPVGPDLVYWVHDLPAGIIFEGFSGGLMATVN